ncbi:MAG: hypothetical protein PHU54_07760 [Candidatus Omnitrophica bacterium]|nr:hypothetical protein [Candidatus Omnitrophota bacterium]
MDAFLMRQFGRPPDELDDIDVARVFRALEAERLVEEVRKVRRYESDGGEIDIDYDVLMELEAWRQRKND